MCILNFERFDVLCVKYKRLKRPEEMFKTRVTGEGWLLQYTMCLQVKCAAGD